MHWFLGSKVKTAIANRAALSLSVSFCLSFSLSLPLSAYQSSICLCVSASLYVSMLEVKCFVNPQFYLMLSLFFVVCFRCAVTALRYGKKNIEQVHVFHVYVVKFVCLLFFSFSLSCSLEIHFFSCNAMWFIQENGIVICSDSLLLLSFILYEETKEMQNSTFVH